MANEVELKFDVEPGGADAVCSAGALASAESTRKDYDTLYFDTKDGALRRAGYSLRVRRSDGRCVQTVKRKKGSSAGLFVRQEWEAEVPDFQIDRAALGLTPLGRRLDNSHPAELVPVVRTRFRRTSWLVDHQGSRVEVVLDQGKISCGRKETPLNELELELLEGKPRALFALAEAIGIAAPLRLGVLSKADRGHAFAEGWLGRAVKAEPIRLRPPLSEAEAFHTVAHACLRHFRLNEMVLLAEPGPDALHQARVALRRLRSALSLFRPTVRGKEYQHLREELRWLASQLGEARNLDVMLARVEAAAQPNEALVAELGPARDSAYERVAAALGAERARQLMLRLALWIEAGPWRFRERGSHDVAVLAAEQLERRWRRISRRGDRLTALDEEERHQLRLDVKKLRYASEFLASLYSEKPLSARRDRFVGGLKVLQERLGELNDAWTAEQLTARLSLELAAPVGPVHSEAEQKRAMRAAEKAFHRAASAAGYWREA